MSLDNTKKHSPSPQIYAFEFIRPRKRTVHRQTDKHIWIELRVLELTEEDFLSITEKNAAEEMIINIPLFINFLLDSTNEFHFQPIIETFVFFPTLGFWRTTQDMLDIKQCVYCGFSFIRLQVVLGYF